MEMIFRFDDDSTFAGEPYRVINPLRTTLNSSSSFRRSSLAMFLKQIYLRRADATRRAAVTRKYRSANRSAAWKGHREGVVACRTWRMPCRLYRAMWPAWICAPKRKILGFHDALQHSARCTESRTWSNLNMRSDIFMKGDCAMLPRGPFARFDVFKLRTPRFISGNQHPSAYAALFRPLCGFFIVFTVLILFLQRTILFLKQTPFAIGWQFAHKYAEHPRTRVWEDLWRF